METQGKRFIIFCHNGVERAVVHSWARNNALITLPYYYEPFEKLENDNGIYRIVEPKSYFWRFMECMFFTKKSIRIISPDITNAVLVCESESDLSECEKETLKRYNKSREKKTFSQIKNLDEEFGKILERCDNDFLNC